MAHTCRGSCKRVGCAPAMHTVGVEPASREAYVSTPAQALLGQGRSGEPLLRNEAREGALCLAPECFVGVLPCILAPELH